MLVPPAPRRQPATPTFTPTDDVLAPTSPIGLPFAPQPVAVFDRAAVTRASVASSPSYFGDDLGDGPLPATPTYTGSSPTYIDEAEPPTPTLDADQDDAFPDPFVPGPAAIAAPGVLAPPLQAKPQDVPTSAMRLPGMESPTPTYEPDNDDEDSDFSHVVVPPSGNRPTVTSTQGLSALGSRTSTVAVGGAASSAAGPASAALTPSTAGVA